jgi:iron complex transport system substrate-binding protein
MDEHHPIGSSIPCCWLSARHQRGDVALLPGYGMAEASMEQILLWDPDMIIIGRGSQASLYSAITTDEKWADLQAVQSGKVSLRPDNPLSWFDGPPGPCQILGMYWMVNLLYPDKTQDLDLNAKIKEFYSNYLHYELTDAEVEVLLSNPS